MHNFTSFICIMKLEFYISMTNIHENRCIFLNEGQKNPLADTHFYFLFFPFLTFTTSSPYSISTLLGSFSFSHQAFSFFSYPLSFSAFFEGLSGSPPNVGNNQLIFFSKVAGLFFTASITSLQFYLFSSLSVLPIIKSGKSFLSFRLKLVFA